MRTREIEQKKNEQWNLENPLVREFLGHIAHILAAEYVELMKGARRSQRRHQEAINKSRSTARRGIMKRAAVYARYSSDTVCWFFPVFGFLSPGAWDLDQTEFNIVLIPMEKTAL